jgi:hypothetical protein
LVVENTTFLLKHGFCEEEGRGTVLIFVHVLDFKNIRNAGGTKEGRYVMLFAMDAMLLSA